LFPLTDKILKQADTHRDKVQRHQIIAHIIGIGAWRWHYGVYVQIEILIIEVPADENIERVHFILTKGVMIHKLEDAVAI
jgi:hypothetical protein